MTSLSNFNNAALAHCKSGHKQGAEATLLKARDGTLENGIGR
jgi:hypothetical protein